MSSPLGVRRRPGVLDATRSALIPLRPLTIGEILDAAFLVLRHNARTMVGLPFAVAGAAALYALLLAGLWWGVGSVAGETAQVLLVVLAGLLGLLMLSLIVSWMTALLTRVSLHTALGEGFAPAQNQVTWRRVRSMFWPMAGVSVLQAVASSLVQVVVSVVYYVLLLVITIPALQGRSTFGFVTGWVLSAVLALLLYSAASSYIALVVPAWSVESSGMPGWIGKPIRPTNIGSAFIRSITLIGLRNLARCTAVMLATILLSVLTAAALWVGVVLVCLLYADSLGLDLLTLISQPWALVGTYAVVLVICVSGMVAFTASVQTVMYLDLRMRREGLDLALRFDDVDVPQPVPPPVVRWVPVAAVQPQRAGYGPGRQA